MSDHPEQQSGLDTAIDRAVRDMMQTDPRPGLRRRVLEKLNDASVRRQWLTAPVVTVAALVLVAAVVFTSLRDDRSEPVPQAVVASGRPDIPATAAPVPVSEPPRTNIAATRPRRTAEAIFGRRRGTVVGASVEPFLATSEEPRIVAEPGDPTQESPLTALAPLVVPALVVRPIEVTRIPGPPRSGSH